MVKWVFAAIAASIAVYLLAVFSADIKEKRMVRKALEQLQAEVAFDYADAPEDIHAVALAIRQGEVPDAELLKQIGPEALSARYLSEPNENKVIFPAYLLHDTMLHKPLNYPAAEALVSAGADVNYSKNRMAFSALRLMQGSKVKPFPDYSPGIPFLRLYLENGGDPNAQLMSGNKGLTPLKYAHDNLEGTLLLFEYGADPWYQAPSLISGRPTRSYFDSLSQSASGTVSGEIMFRVVNAGYFTNPPQDQLETIFTTFTRSLRDKQGTNNPSQLQSAWYRQTILDAIVETAGVTLPSELAQLVENRIPDQYGGWWMRPDQVRSGDEFVGPTITDGTLIWTHADPDPRQRPEQ